MKLSDFNPKRALEKTIRVIIKSPLSGLPINDGSFWVDVYSGFSDLGRNAMTQAKRDYEAENIDDKTFEQWLSTPENSASIIVQLIANSSDSFKDEASDVKAFLISEPWVLSQIEQSAYTMSAFDPKPEAA